MGLSEKQNMYLAIAWQCFETEPKIDYEKFAAAAGLASANSAREMMRLTKNKLKSEYGVLWADGSGKNGGCSAVATPTKKGGKGGGKSVSATPASKKRKVEGKKKGVDDEDEDEDGALGSDGERKKLKKGSGVVDGDGAGDVDAGAEVDGEADGEVAEVVVKGDEEEEYSFF